ncbi:2-dehydro-3-deoxygalactonokinase [Poseidonocella pacifica]|uniref:2-dehydro-3-deoxygalactonokinase n=1 Tax=Poseidonocella pacifica TaxID=871651 RepID=A0A1I0XUZ1_9RHOB|nr:2-dehydro-3-deoxygalactonokinase [Poseidonocella pacifica]SFB04885.1 2-dehydro-3-deoxygalactonokinase [Poseidonocella pacifica]
MTAAINPQDILWVAVDWGTTRLRAWAMGEGGTVLSSASSEDGMGALARHEFEDALLRLAGDWLAPGIPVIACGMVGSRQGWVEAPYRVVPARPAADELVSAPAKRAGLDVRVVPGLKQTSPADVMRGEETQIAGFLALHPGWDGVICLPGTHTKWAHLSAGEVVSFQTFMTGDLFAAISGHTVLRHSVGTEGREGTDFDDAVEEIMTRPERLASRLFGLRAQGLLEGLDPAAATAALSGMLLGAELAAARPYWLGQQIAILGANSLAQRYARALALQHVDATIVEADACTLAGLTAQYKKATS